MANVAGNFGVPVVLTASGVVKNAQGFLLGWFVNTLTSAPTLDLFDNPSAATGTLSSHPVVSYVLQPGFTPFPWAFATGCYASINGTANIAFLYG
jgi:hypothetical protein